MFFSSFGDWNGKVGSQEIPGITGKFGLRVQNEAVQRLTVLSRECTCHNKHTLPTTQETTQHRDGTRWSVPKSPWRSSIQSGKARHGANCGSDHQLLTEKFGLKLKKIGKPHNHSGYD